MSKWVKIEVPDDFDNEFILSHDREMPVWNPEDTYVNVLDHGYIGLVDFMGDDEAIVRSARVSYGKGTKKVQSDRNLIRYLLNNYHMTPIEACEFTFHVKAPIFVFRQLMRHRNGVFNEYSARYSEMSDDFYIPNPEHMLPQSPDNKQGRTDEVLSDTNYKACWTAIEQVFEDSYMTYKHLLGTTEGDKATALPDILEQRKKFLEEAAMQGLLKMQKTAKNRGEELEITDDMISEKIADYMEQQGFATVSDDFTGIAKELARIVLPVSVYSQLYWKCDLLSLFNFIHLRADPHAQYEIRVYAEAILEMIRPIVPWAIEAFEDYWMNATSLSAMETTIVEKLISKALTGTDKSILKDDIIKDMKELGCSKREIDDFCKKFSI